MFCMLTLLGLQGAESAVDVEDSDLLAVPSSFAEDLGDLQEAGTISL